MTQLKVVYSCGTCGKEYKTEKEALECEKQGVELYKYNVGDRFIISYEKEPTGLCDVVEITEINSIFCAHEASYTVEITSKSCCPFCKGEFESGRHRAHMTSKTQGELDRTIIAKL